MCGIAGICNFSGEAVSAGSLRRMTDTLAHRGPDGEGQYTDANVGLGNRRLAIIDLTEAGHQPMASRDGDVVIVYNGEIYNFPQLRVELEALGYLFHSRTDTEVVLHAYEAWGADSIRRLNGHFAFALWDRRSRRLLLARDRFGVKPLYYRNDGRRFLFASEIKAILSCSDAAPRVSRTALNEYFTFQNVLRDQTLFEGVHLLPPGTWLVVDAESGRVESHTWWDYRFDADSMSFEDATEELQRLFDAAVTRQLISDVPVASYLSGGLDSSSIAAVAARKLGRISTFTCGFDLSSASGLELGFDERAYSEALANHIKSEHYEIVLHAGDMEHALPALIRHLEDLRVGQCYPNFYVARLAGKFVKVVLSGVGGDELFGGYPWRYYRGVSDDPESFFHDYYDFWQRLVSDSEKQAFFSADVWADVRHDSTYDVFRNVFRQGDLHPVTVEQAVDASLYFELRTFLTGLLVVEDKLSMAHSLETRAPFLDNDLVDFALRVPARYKLRDLTSFESVDEDELAKRRRYEIRTGEGKMILRRAAAKFVPEEVAQRVKQGFSAPDASWFRGESIEYVKKSLLDRRARIFDYLRYEFVVAKVEEHVRGERNHRLFIWSLLSFEQWLRTFIP